MVYKFIQKALLLCIIIACTCWLIFTCFTKGYVDNYYFRFTSPKAGSMILGSSRAAQGLNPDLVFKGINCSEPALNFAFTQLNSPYGPVYFRAVDRKLKQSTENGLFLLAVSPTMLSVDDSIGSNPDCFLENELFLGRQWTFNCDPNWEYLFRNYNKPLYKLILFNNQEHFKLKLHKNGWLEVTVPMDEKSLQKRIKRKFKEYRKLFNKSRLSRLELSEIRISYFILTIRYLKKYGNVVLLRLPVSNGMRLMEDEYVPKFDNLITSIAESENVPYLNYHGRDDFQTTDGNHLHKASGIRLSIEINKELKKLFTKPTGSDS